MDSNGGKTKMSSSGMSLAFQRAKEHPNRSSGVEVRGENVKWTRLILGGPCAQARRPWTRGPVRTVQVRGHGVSRDFSGTRGYGVGGNFAISLSNSMGERKIGVWGHNRS